MTNLIVSQRELRDKNVELFAIGSGFHAVKY